MNTLDQDLLYRLRKRAEIRRQIETRKSVREGKPDRIADLLEEAADKIATLEKERVKLLFALQSAWPYVHGHCTINSVMNEIKGALGFESNSLLTEGSMKTNIKEEQDIPKPPAPPPPKIIREGIEVKK